MSAAAARAGSLRFPDAAVAPARRAMPRDDIKAVDPRWVLAVAAVRSLEGGRAAILPSEERERLVRLAGALGLRAFDAALVIAVVQDAARRGDPLGGEVADRLAFIQAPTVRERGVRDLLVASALLGLGILCVLTTLVVV